MFQWVRNLVREFCGEKNTRKALRDLAAPADAAVGEESDKSGGRGDR